jgi:hypothetical protein
MPTERPILFSDPMVRAILDGRKTQTRRLVRFLSGMETPSRAFGGLNPPDQGHVCDRLELCDWVGGAWSWYSSDGGCTCKAAARSPHGWPGDHLWVREAWAPLDADSCHPSDIRTPHLVPADTEIAYRADHDGETDWTTWRPSIHMPRWASRLTLRVTSVRVERLQSISDEDALAEGIALRRHDAARGEFHALWDSINADRAPWSSDPWVWVVSFEVAR